VAGADLGRALGALRTGKIVVYPTETLYGLGCDATDDRALRRLVALKGRDGGKPISVLVDSRAMLERIVAGVSASAERLIDAFWPGALTIVLPARADLSPLLTGGRGTIGARISPHAVAARLVEALGRPLTSTSANPGGQPPATTVAEARGLFGDAVTAYLDGGMLAGGVGSSVVDCTVDPPVLFREGVVSRAAIAAALGVEPAAPTAN
jgi:L-threonylcarbamoyladenylate synthase